MQIRNSPVARPISPTAGPLKAATMKIVGIDRYATGPQTVNLLFIVIKLTQ